MFECNVFEGKKGRKGINGKFHPEIILEVKRVVLFSKENSLLHKTAI